MNVEVKTATARRKGSPSIKPSKRQRCVRWNSPGARKTSHEDAENAKWLPERLVRFMGTSPLQRLLLMMVMMLSPLVKGELYWAYVPDPPVLHPSIWEGPEIMVKVNDMRLLDQPATGRGDKREERRFNYTGSGIGLPICFSKRWSATTGCLPVYVSSLIRNKEKKASVFQI
uniref:Uncharacterized protein n=1 Tax=Rousettus aegyptiacus TaxID=9407 RepID=A0A7J8BSH2_ROUAE|nr:hypothetical protein HJG63_009560 [Rousettus aegyptiacus]